MGLPAGVAEPARWAAVARGGVPIVRQLLRTEAVPRLVSLLRRGDRRSKQWAAAALCNLSPLEEGKEAILRGGGIDAAHRVLTKRGPLGGLEAARSDGLQVSVGRHPTPCPAPPSIM